MKDHGGAESRKTSCGDLGFHQYNQLCLSLTKQHGACCLSDNLKSKPILVTITMDRFFFHQGPVNDDKNTEGG